MQRALLAALFLALALGLNALTSRSAAQDAVGAAGGLVDPARGPDSVLSLTSATSHPRVLAGGPREVYLHLSLDAAESPRMVRPALNLALVIDRSGSMASERKLEFARSAAQQLVERLEPDDHLAIVAYDDQVHTLVPSTPARERQVFLDAIRGLRPGNATNLHGGMMAGYEEVLRHFDDERSNRVLLLSDGLANAGVTDPHAIRTRAAACRERGVRISTMGMGVSYDEVLMGGIALEAGGNYYYVDRAESVGRYLDREVDEISRLVARDLELCLELGPGVELSEVFGYLHHIEEGELRVPVNDMFGGEHHKVVLRLRVQGRAGRRSKLATASLRYVDAASRESRRECAPTLYHRFTESVEEVELSRRLDVLIQVEVVHNAQALLDAMKLQKYGKIEAAQELLDARYRNSKLVNDTEYRSAELTRILRRMHQVLLDLERTRSDPAAMRDLQLATELRGLGYMGD